ncbi:MAG: type II secretion system F family protein [bacterium]|nr:type II secretion system F family protein [bacterium]
MNIFVAVYHVLQDIVCFPITIFRKIKQKHFKKQNQEEDVQRQLMQETVQNSTSFAGDNAEAILADVNSNDKVDKSNLLTFNYIVKNDYGQEIKSSFDAKSASEVEAFLVNEGYQVVKIELKKKSFLDADIRLFGSKMKAGELSFSLTQLSTYIKAGIPLIDSVRILAKQSTKPAKRKIYEKVVFDLVAGENFSKALENQKDVFPRLLINMVKASELTGDLTATLDEMSDYYTSIEETKKQMISALTYPCIVLVLAIVVIAFCLIWVVPNFIDMFSDVESELPLITQITVSASNFMSNNYLMILAIVVVITVVYMIAFRNIKSFRKAMQTFFMKFPVIGKIIIYNEVTMFTKTFAQLLNHSVHITDSMAILSKISNNEIYKEIIANTLNTLSKGGKISESFRGQWAFPVVAYEMLVTGESTGQLGVMMDKVAAHFNNLHKTAVTQVKSLIEPITICFLAVAVGFILLSIIIPMFDLYNAVGGM